MVNTEIFHKNEKLTKRLLHLKNEKYKLTLSDEIKLKFLDKYTISDREENIIDEILESIDFIKFANHRNWTSPDNQDYCIKEFPYITDNGLKAIKSNYFEVSFIIKKLNTPQIILNAILTIIIIITTSFGIFSKCDSNKLKKELGIKNKTIDSLKLQITTLNQSIEKNKAIIDLKTNPKDSLNIKNPK